MTKRIHLPITREQARSLKAGERVLLTGTLYTARDAAHKRLREEAQAGQALPVHLKDIAIYYAGPTPAKPGHIIGSCGPTTSGRMDVYAPWMIEQGQTVMIGKGLRNETVIEAMKKYGSVYLTAIGGAGALLSKCVTRMECIAYEEFGAEAIYKLEVEDFPTIVTIDCEGHNLYIQE